MNTGRVVALLKDFEGFLPYVYDDRSPWPRSEVTRLDCREVAGQYKVNATGGTATVGYGETSADFIDRYWGRRITQAEALAKMADRVQGFYQGVMGCIEVDLTEHQWEAVTCRAYQSGAGGFCRSETARLLNDGNVAGALAMWKKEFAHPNRSEVEIAHFLTPDEEAPMTTRIYTRDEWAARAPTGRSPAPGMSRGIGVHYLGEGRGPTGGLAASMAKMREVQAFHMGPSRGWADFAYNWAVDMHGNAFEGRGVRIRNAANGGGVRNGYDANAGWSSLLYLNGTGGPDLTDAAKRAINDVAVHAGVAGGEWLGHRDFLSTACPGDQTYEWVHAGHPGGAPEPQPAPEPEDDMAGLFLFDYVPDGTTTPVAILYTDGKLKWGLESGEQLAFFATGKVPHLGAKGDQFFHELDWHPGGKDSRPEQRLAALAASPDVVDVEGGHYSLAGGITEAMERSSFETGDPGCGT